MQRRMFSASVLAGIGLALSLLSAAPAQAAPAQTVPDTSGRGTAAEKAQCRNIEFTKASVDPLGAGTSPDRYRLTVSGSAPSSNVSVELTPLVYIRQPEFWGIQVLGCSSRNGLPVMVPYTATYEFTGALGTCGIEVVGTSKRQRFDLAGCAPAPLPGTAWALDPASLGVPVPEGVTIAADFGATTVSGFTGCNSYYANYAVGEDGTFTIGAIAMTARACEGAISGAESAFIRKLAAVDEYRATETELSLLADGKLALRFVPDKA